MQKTNVYAAARCGERVTEPPYGINLWYSDSDMPNGSIFETIVARIRQSDFCVFDDRETEVPNVLIELGVAIGIGKPYFNLNYAQGCHRAA